MKQEMPQKKQQDKWCGQGKLKRVMGLLVICLVWGYFWVGPGNSVASPDLSTVTTRTVATVLEEKINSSFRAWAILVNGQPLVALASQSEAQAVLDRLPTYFLKDKEVECKVESCQFAEEVGLAPWLTAQTVMTPAEALALLAQGRTEQGEHVVETGESLWLIAREYGLSVKELEALNPNLQGRYLQPGDVLQLQKKEPCLTFVSTVKLIVEEELPYKTVYEKDATLWLGEEKVKKAGRPGVSKVIYQVKLDQEGELARELVERQTICEPQSRLVSRGAKALVASRSGAGSGALSWPLQGRITSPYGQKRGASIHTGLDIGAPHGTSVRAAASGQVVSAGWKGTYGNCIELNHGQNLRTLYAHLSQIKVAVGEEVTRDSIIGQVGSTGNSTGPHLHFEVRVNGKHTNPRNYLK